MYSSERNIWQSWQFRQKDLKASLGLETYLARSHVQAAQTRLLREKRVAMLYFHLMVLVNMSGRCAVWSFVIWRGYHSWQPFPISGLGLSKLLHYVLKLAASMLSKPCQYTHLLHCLWKRGSSDWWGVWSKNGEIACQGTKTLTASWEMMICYEGRR